MSPRRSSEPPRRSRLLVLSGVTAALLVVPGVAHAAGDPISPVTDGVTGTVDSVTGAITGGTLPAGPTLPDVPGNVADSGTDADTDPDTAAGATPPALPDLDVSQLQTLLSALNVSPDCAPAIKGDLEATLASIPLTVQEIIGQLGNQLTDLLDDPAAAPVSLQAALMDVAADQGTDPAGIAGLPLLTSLQDLVQDFLTLCLPQPAAAVSTPTPTAAPAAATTSPPPAAPAPAAAPVAYLGYAPTGVTDDDSGDGNPLAVLGGVLLLTGAAGAGSWMRSRRAASTRN